MQPLARKAIYLDGARLPKHMCAFGRMLIELSRLPAGTTSKAPIN